MFQRLFFSQHFLPRSLHSSILTLWDKQKSTVILSSPFSFPVHEKTHNNSMLNSCAFLFSYRPSWSCNGCSTWSRCVHFQHGSVMSMSFNCLAEWQYYFSNPNPATHQQKLALDLACYELTNSLSSITNLCFSFSFGLILSCFVSLMSWSQC